MVRGVWCDASDDESESEDEDEDDESGTRNDRFMVLSTEEDQVIHFATEAKGGLLCFTVKTSTQGNHFILSKPTICAGNLLNGRVLIQICEDRMRVFKAVSNPALPAPLSRRCVCGSARAHPPIQVKTEVQATLHMSLQRPYLTLMCYCNFQMARFC